MSRHTRVVVLVAVALALAAAGGLAAADAGAAQEDLVTITVTVVGPDGDGVGGADVEVAWENASETQTSRQNGQSLFDVPEGADIEITIDHSEYVRNFPATVSSVESGQEIDVPVHDPGTAEVTVTDGDSPVEGALVRIRRDGQSDYAARGDTDADGVWTSGEVEAGSYTVRVREPGYFNVRRTVEVANGTEASIQLEEGDVNVDLLVQDPVDAGPGPLQADVEIERDGQRVVSVTTDEDGERTVSLPVNTRFDVQVTRDGYESLSTTLRTGEEAQEATFEITREEAIGIEADNSRVVVGETLRVVVTDEYDRPVEGATVTVDGEESGETDVDGVARVEIPRQGNLSVAAAFSGLETEALTVTGIDPAEADEEESGDDGDGDDGTPGFGVVAALVGALLGVLAAVRRR